jgi:hypothetical protein
MEDIEELSLTAELMLIDGSGKPSKRKRLEEGNRYRTGQKGRRVEVR